MQGSDAKSTTAGSAAGALAARVRAHGRTRYIVGIAGPPGSGKSTVADIVVDALVTAGIATIALPMDGFHLADTTLERLGRLARKGAPDTFDGSGYVELLRRIRRDTSTIYAPGFERDQELPIAGFLAIPSETRVVVTEGNYLLLDQDPWAAVAAELDEAWYVDTDDDVRRSRLRSRHEAFGKSSGAAARWVDVVDEPNAVLVRAQRGRAERFIAN